MIKGTKGFTPLETIGKQIRDKVSLTGFTLVELLITSSIFVVIMLTIYSAFHTGIFSYRNIQDSIDTHQAAGQILERINLDLRNCFVYSADETRFEGKNKQISFLALADSYQEDNIVQDYAFISYGLEGDKLMRLCRKNLEALNDKSEIKPEEMADNVDIVFSYFYIDRADNSLKEKEIWNDPKNLPTAVKINLTLKGKTELNFERIIYLPLAN